jgi:hypothetical protein
MKIEQIPVFDQLPLHGATHFIDVSAADLTQTTANTAQTLVPANFRAGDAFQLVAMKLVEPFENTADAAHDTTTLSVGDDDSATRYLASTQLNANGSTVSFAAGALTAPCFVYTAAKELRLAFGSQTAKSLSNLNKGRVLLFIKKVDLRRYGPYT